MVSWLYQSDDNLFIVLKHLLRLLKVKVTDASLYQTLQEHPNYPSLLSVLDCLKMWGVESWGIRVSFDRLITLPCPMLVHFNNDRLLLVTRISYTSIRCLNDKYESVDISKEEFIKKWKGVALLVVAPDSSPSNMRGKVTAGEINYRSKHIHEIGERLRIPGVLFIILFTIVLTGIISYHSFGIKVIFSLLHAILMLLGTMISGLLLWSEVDRQYPILRKVCTSGKKLNCSAVLHSSMASLWGIISWSEIGFAYFTGGLICLLFSGFDPFITSVVSWLNVLALPFVFFSIFYQWKVIKQWCVLCLMVQFLLITGFIVCLVGQHYSVMPKGLTAMAIMQLVLAYLVPILLWRQTKSLGVKAMEREHFKILFFRLKHDPNIFHALLPKQKVISLEEVQHLGIPLGNPNAKHNIVKVCNPYCEPCAMAHPELEKILESNTDVHIRIIFTATDDEKDKRSHPAKHLLAIMEKGDEELTKKALDDWYKSEIKDYDIFAKKYPMNGELSRQGEKLKVMNEWCEMIGVTFTPTFFINGYQLPEIYSIQDLRYLLT